MTSFTVQKSTKYNSPPQNSNFWPKLQIKLQKKMTSANVLINGLSLPKIVLHFLPFPFGDTGKERTYLNTDINSWVTVKKLKFL